MNRTNCLVACRTIFQKFDLIPLVLAGAVLFSVTLFSASSEGASDALSDASSGAPVAQETLVAQEKRRLEELFILKMSEELKLSVEKKTSFAETIRSLNREKTKANLAISDALTAIDKAQSADRTKSRKETEKAVRKYESAWRAYGALPLREVSRLRAILGTEALGRYLVAKSQMIEKLTALSANPSVNPTPSPPAKPEVK